MKKKIKELQEIPLRPMFPNMVTMLNLCCGVTSMSFAVWGMWKEAIWAIALGGIFDLLDGRVARMLNTSSKLGAELDSLSDCVSFGVAPGFLLYQWTMNQTLRADAIAGGVKDVAAVGVPWWVVLFLAMCCAWRLARFNTMLDAKTPSYWTHFFMGLPAPGGAYLALMPLIFYLWSGSEFFRSVPVVCGFMIAAGILMASRIPTPCFKKVHMPKLPSAFSQAAGLIALALLALLVMMLIKNFWMVLSIIGIIYLIMLPLGIMLFIKLRRQEV